MLQLFSAEFAYNKVISPTLPHPPNTKTYLGGLQFDRSDYQSDYLLVGDRAAIDFAVCQVVN